MSMSVQRFTSSGTFTVPAGVTSLILLGQGGGSGGTSGSTQFTQRASGSALAVGTLLQMIVVEVTPNTTYTVTIGAGGTGGVWDSGSSTTFQRGTSGGDTSFGNTIFSGGPVGFDINQSFPMWITHAGSNRDQSNALYDSGTQGADSGIYLGGSGSPGSSEGVGANGGNGNNAGVGFNGSNATNPGCSGGNGGCGNAGGGSGGDGAPGQLYICWAV